MKKKKAIPMLPMAQVGTFNVNRKYLTFNVNRKYLTFNVNRKY